MEERPRSLFHHRKRHPLHEHPKKKPNRSSLLSPSSDGDGDGNYVYSSSSSSSLSSFSFNQDDGDADANADANANAYDAGFLENGSRRSISSRNGKRPKTRRRGRHVQHRCQRISHYLRLTILVINQRPLLSLRNVLLAILCVTTTLWVLFLLISTSSTSSSITSPFTTSNDEHALAFSLRRSVSTQKTSRIVLPINITSSRQARREIPIPPLVPPTVVGLPSATTNSIHKSNTTATTTTSHTDDSSAWLHWALPAASLPTLQRDCATLRYRTSSISATTTTTTTTIHRLGLEFLEHVNGFTSLHQNAFHFYHWLEFIVVAYVEFHQLVLSQQQRDNTPLVQWIHVPHFTMPQICGTSPHQPSLNCLLAHLVFGNDDDQHQSSSSSSSPSPSPPLIFGLESNNNETATQHAKLRPAPMKEPSLWAAWFGAGASPSGGTSKENTSANESHSRSHDRRMQDVDAILTIQRPGCVARQREYKKMWMDFIDHFPAQQWHQQITQGLPQTKTTATIRIGYIDRQNTGRRLPSSFHQFFVSYLTNLSQQKQQQQQPQDDDSNDIAIEFLHLHMETLPALRQIQTAATLDLLIGTHGNGLSHLFFQKPNNNSAVLELFWDSPFQFDYATGAQMMGHDYLCLYNGRAVPADRIANRDVRLKEELSSSPLWILDNSKGDAIDAAMATGTRIAAQFIDDTVARLRQERRASHVADDAT